MGVGGVCCCGCFPHRKTGAMIVDVEEINLVSPYRVCQGEKEGEFLFSSAAGTIYKAVFMRDEALFRGLVVRHFSLTSTNWSTHDRHAQDPNVKETVFEILKNFLSRNHQVMVYVCDNDDGRHRFRNKLFNSWFSQVDRLSEGQFLRRTVEYSFEGISAYGGMVCRSDNPLSEQYLDAFDKYMKLLYEDKQ